MGVEPARDALVRQAAELHPPQHPRVLDRDLERLAGAIVVDGGAVRRERRRFEPVDAGAQDDGRRA